MNVDIQKFLIDNLYLVAIALVSGGLLLWPLVRRGTGGPSVNTVEAIQLINRKDALVLDVRSSEEYQRGHIIHSRNIPLEQLESGTAPIEKYKDKPIIVACETGSRSGAAGAKLRKHGFNQVFGLAGGIGAWREAGLPVEKA